ncbi:MAG: phospholipid carrier-dependent glycosyltransferase, partial [Calditrichaeota bacterium]
MTEKNINAVHLLIMGFTLTVAAVLRLVGIHFGLPQAFHTDETILVYATRQFFQGDFNPHNFYYPSLIMYVMHLVQRIVLIFSNGEFSTNTLFLICRITVAAFGVATIIVTYRMGLKLFNRTIALLSAFVMTLLPLHVINSHLATTDVPLTFFILLTLSSMFILVERGAWKSYLLCGVLFGLTVSTKIPGAVIFLPILIAHFYRVQLETGLKYGALLRRLSWFHWIVSGAMGILGGLVVFVVLSNFQSIVQWINSTFAVDVWLDHPQRIVAAVTPQRLKFAVIAFFALFLFLITSPIWRLHLHKLLLLIGASLAAFFMTTPFALLDYKTFIKDFLHQMVVSQTTWGGMFYQAPPGLITNFRYLYQEFGWILFTFFLAGTVLLLRKASIHRILLLSVLWVYFLYISSWKILFDRYMTPVLPLMSLITLYGLDTLMGGLLKNLRLKSILKRSLHIVLYALVLVLPLGNMLYKSIDYDRYLLKKSTRTLAYEWGV